METPPRYAPPPFSLRQLQYAAAVAETLSFREAAARCRVSQPSLSAQLAQLEEALGARLFERGRRGVLITSAGEALLPELRGLLQASASLLGAAQRLRDPLAGRLRLGVIPSIGPYLLPRLDPTLRDRFPGLRPRWLEDKTAALVEALREGRLDAALVAEESELPGLELARIGFDPFLLATTPTDPLVGRGRVSLGALTGRPVLLLTEGHCLRDQALSICGAAGAEAQAFRSTSLATLVQLVAAGEGVTLLPELALPVENRHRQLRTRRFKTPQPGRNLAFAWRAGSPLADAARALAEVGAELLGAPARR